MVPAEKLSQALIHDTLRPPSPRRALRARVVRFTLRWGLLLAAALWTVGGFARATVANYEIDNLKAAYQSAVAEHQSLEISSARLESPGRLVQVANSNHLTTPNAVLIVYTGTPRPNDAAPNALGKPGFLTSAVRDVLNLFVGALDNAIGTW